MNTVWRVSFVAVLAPGPAVADACRPAAIVDGHDELSDEVMRELVSHGIDVEPRATCPSVRVKLAREGDRITIVLTDPAGRDVTRSVTRVGEVVSVIESWARPDANADLLEGFEVPAAPAAAESKPPPAPLSITRAPVEPRDARDPLTISLVGDLAIERTTSWIGAMASACTPLGPICVGGTGHLRRSSSRPTEAAVLASLDVPLPARRWVLMPGIAIGASRHEAEDMGQGMNDEAGAIWSPQVEARLIASYPVKRRMFVDFMIGVVGAPSTDEQGQNEDSESSSSAGGPVVRFELGAGLRLGTP